MEGASLRFSGQWENQPKYGKQFLVKNMEAIAHSSEGDLVVYLSGGMLPGVGPATAANIVQMFGERTMEVPFPSSDLKQD